MSWIAAGLAIAAVLATAPVAAEPADDLLSLPVRHARDSATSLGGALHGAPAIVTFWATYCPPCRAEVPVLQRAVRRWRPSGVRVVGVVVDLDDAAEVEHAAREWGIDYETYWVTPDTHDRLAKLVPAGLPVTFFVGPDGVARYDRLLGDADLDRLVPQHLHVRASPEGTT